MSKKTFGDHVRHERRRRGFTLDELARATGISKPYLSLIENNRVRPPSDPKVMKLESSLGFKSGFLLAISHIAKTPLDVRKALEELYRQSNGTATEMPGTVSN